MCETFVNTRQIMKHAVQVTVLAGVRSHLIHTIFLNTKFPSEPFTCIFLGRVLLDLCHIAVPQSHLDSKKHKSQTRRCDRLFAQVQTGEFSNLVHPVRLHSKLPSVSVRRFGSVVLLLHPLMLHSDLVPELCDAGRSNGGGSHTLLWSCQLKIV